MLNKTWEKRREQLYKMVDVGNDETFMNRFYDFFSTGALIINIAASTAYTFNYMEEHYGELLLTIEAVTVFFFAMDCFMRIITAKYQYPDSGELKAIGKYVFSFSGLIDILSFVPYYLPIFFPTGAAVFRMFRVIRIFRLFRINAYYDSLNVISEVILGKRQQLISSVFIILVLMMASSLCMYSIENVAQPEVFSNAFSGIWWSVSTLLTVGYGDIYPVTTMGKLVGTVITFLGVGMVAIPTGIISAGFVDQYSRIKRISEYGREEEVNFIKVHLTEKDSWVGMSLKDLKLPGGVLVAVVMRDEKTIVPRGDLVLKEEDVLVIGAESYQSDRHVDLKEVVLKEHHPWSGQHIRDLDISRQTIIVMVKRKGKVLIPRGDMILQEGDLVIIYSQVYIPHAMNVRV